jgi:hypothetical protein
VGAEKDVLCALLHEDTASVTCFQSACRSEVLYVYTAICVHIHLPPLCVVKYCRPRTMTGSRTNRMKTKSRTRMGNAAIECDVCGSVYIRTCAPILKRICECEMHKIRVRADQEQIEVLLRIASCGTSRRAYTPAPLPAPACRRDEPHPGGPRVRARAGAGYLVLVRARGRSRDRGRVLMSSASTFGSRHQHAPAVARPH